MRNNLSMNDQDKLLLLQVLAHIALGYCLFNLSWTVLSIILVVYFFTGCIGMTVTYHRLLSHKSWDAPDWFRKFGTICGVYGITGSPLAWVAVHREHHRYSDQPEDPHGPEHQGFWRVQFLSMYHPVKPLYIKDLLRDKFMVAIHANYFKIHAALLTLTVIMCVFIPAQIVFACYLAPAAVLWHMGSLINTLNHMWGYRVCETRDQSYNNPITGYLLWGEGWHNQHHGDRSSPKFGRKWWEIDVGYWMIRLFARKG